MSLLFLASSLLNMSVGGGNVTKATRTGRGKSHPCITRKKVHDTAWGNRADLSRVKHVAVVQYTTRKEGVVVRQCTARTEGSLHIDIHGSLVLKSLQKQK